MHCTTKLIMSNVTPKHWITKFIRKQCKPNALHNYACLSEAMDCTTMVIISDLIPYLILLRCTTMLIISQ